jgi:hypothetical protein
MMSKRIEDCQVALLRSLWAHCVVVRLGQCGTRSERDGLDGEFSCDFHGVGCNRSIREKETTSEEGREAVIYLEDYAEKGGTCSGSGAPQKYRSINLIISFGGTRRSCCARKSEHERGGR